MASVRGPFYKHTQRWRTKARRWATEYCGGQCQGCRYSRYYGNLSFHHLADKDDSVSRLINRCTAWDVILREIDKCVLLCHNCHGEVHAGLRQCPKINKEERAQNWQRLITERPIPKKDQRHPCAFCKKPIPKTKKYCDQKCTHRALERTKWPTNLRELVESSSTVAVAKSLGVSDKAVAKRLAATLGLHEEVGSIPTGGSV